MCLKARLVPSPFGEGGLEGGLEGGWWNFSRGRKGVEGGLEGGSERLGLKGFGGFKENP